MFNRYLKILLLTLMAVLVFAACAPGSIPETGAQGDLAATQNALLIEYARSTATVSAMQTEIASLQTQVVQPTDVSSEVPATETPLAPTPTPTETSLPPTATLVPPTAVPTATPLPCNQALFVQDITITDGATVTAGMGFTKTWRLRNTGSCAWTTDYRLIFYEGEQMSAQAVVAFPHIVYPGQTVDLSVNMVAPSQLGVYRGYWKLRDPYGTIFGLGSSGSAFYVEVKVVAPQSTNPLDLAASYCTAEWTSGAGRLPCQGPSDDSRGLVRRITNPLLESGYQDDEPALLTQPQMINDGIIRGKYPSMRIENGWRFVSVIGCAYQSSGCDVKFQLDYQIDGGTIHTLASWHEVYDGKFQRVEVDLSTLAGKDVNLILTVHANGSSNQDRAQWLAPHITTSLQWSDDFPRPRAE